jgi:hypothetical protein
MQKDMLERELVSEAETHHDHTSHPKEDDITSCFKKIPREEGFEIGILDIGPPKSSEGEESRGEPGV